MGQYTSADPIGLLGGMREWGYVKYPNRQIDALGLAPKLSGVGPYRTMGGHHIHAQSAFKGNPNYSPKDALTISNKYMKCKGLNHNAMTRKQRQLFDELARSGRGNTMAEQDWIATQALIAGGANPAEAAMLTGLSRANLLAQGVTSPSKIPWN